MTKLSDTQAILLSTASGRDGGSILPLPSTLKPGGGATKAIGALMTRGLAEERETTEAGAAYRVEGDTRYGVFVTAAGLAAIGVEPEGGSLGESEVVEAAPTKAPKISKTSVVLDLLRRPAGASSSELIAATGWLPHTTRAALTGLRKKGHEITRGKRDGVTFYTVAAK